MVRTGQFWKLSIIALLALFLLVTAWSIARAVRGVSRVVDADYYRHGLDYNKVRQGWAVAERRGWRMQSDFADGRLTVRVADKSGAPVEGGVMTLNLAPSFAPGNGPLLPVTVLVEGRPGVYSAGLLLARGDELRGTIVFSSGDAAMTGTVVVLN
jgi:hypothetical protein